LHASADAEVQIPGHCRVQSQFSFAVTSAFGGNGRLVRKSLQGHEGVERHTKPETAFTEIAVTPWKEIAAGYFTTYSMDGGDQRSSRKQH
jgi:hypothetical protein